MLFSPKARRTIDRAVNALVDPSQRAYWAMWAQEHPHVRVAGGPADDGTDPMPTGVASVALTALEQMAADLRQQAAFMDEDEAYEVENDLSFIGSIEAALVQEINGGRRRRAA